MLTKNEKGGFELQDMFMFIMFAIMLFVFVAIASPITALFNFDAIANGALLELMINLFAVILSAGFLMSYIKKWNTPGMWFFLKSRIRAWDTNWSIYIYDLKELMKKWIQNWKYSQ